MLLLNAVAKMGTTFLNKPGVRSFLEGLFLHPQHPKCRKLCTQTSLGPSYWFNDHFRNRLIGGTDSIKN
jgi:hypothetical protein